MSDDRESGNIFFPKFLFSDALEMITANISTCNLAADFTSITCMFGRLLSGKNNLDQDLQNPVFVLS